MKKLFFIIAMIAAISSYGQGFLVSDSIDILCPNNGQAVSLLYSFIGSDRSPSAPKKLERLEITNNGIEVLKVTNDSNLYINESVKVITLKDMDEYIEYCHNDSTYVEYYEYHSSVNEDGTVNAVYIPPTLVKEYQHRKPTFEDFYKWIKNKE